MDPKKKGSGLALVCSRQVQRVDWVSVVRRTTILRISLHCCRKDVIECHGGRQAGIARVTTPHSVLGDYGKTLEKAVMDLRKSEPPQD